MTPQEREEWVDDQMYEAEHSFNAGRPERKRVPLKKPKERKRLRKGLERGLDLREEGKDVDTIRAEVKKTMFGSGWLLMLFSFFIENWGDDIIAWIISKLFPSGHQPIGEVQ